MSKTVQRERRYVAEYVAMRFPGDVVSFNVRLFTDPDVSIPGLSAESTLRLISRSGLFVDAIIHRGSDVILIEAKVEMESQALGQLLIYKELIQKTPGFDHLLPEDISLLMVSPITKPWIDPVLRKYGVMVDHWSPDWIVGYLAELKVKRSV